MQMCLVYLDSSFKTRKSSYMYIEASLMHRMSIVDGKQYLVTGNYIFSVILSGKTRSSNLRMSLMVCSAKESVRICRVLISKRFHMTGQVRLGH